MRYREIAFSLTLVSLFNCCQKVTTKEDISPLSPLEEPGVITLDHLEGEGKVRVEIDDKLFTEFIYRGYNKPLLYPIVGPHAIKMTRCWPIEKAATGEQTDHPHHESLWFTHGDVNGVDFWAIKKDETGTIRHLELVKAEILDGRAEIVTTNRWVAPDGNAVCTDRQTIGLESTLAGRVIDYSVTIIASEGDVVFGDTKEGTMGIRFHPRLRLTGKVAAGRANNSEGDKDKSLWGKHAKWVDYYAPIDGYTVGVAIFDHPSNLRHPTTWHARDYGLVTANPFGLSYFQKQPPGSGDMRITKGTEVTFRYRFLFHRGTTSQADIASVYAQWVK